MEPVLLFGETEFEAFKRLRKLEILEPEINKGLRNDFQEALEKVDQAYLNEILKSQGGGESDGTVKSVHDVTVTYEETTMDDILVRNLLEFYLSSATFLSIVNSNNICFKKLQMLTIL